MWTLRDVELKCVDDRKTVVFTFDHEYIDGKRYAELKMWNGNSISDVFIQVTNLATSLFKINSGK